LILTVITSGWPLASESWSRHVKVAVEFRQVATHNADGFQGGGAVVITERRSVQTGGQISAEETQSRVRQSRGIFTIVQDGGESTLTVTTQVPARHVSFYCDYANSAGYVASGVVFREVGTALRVHATILSQNQVRIRLTPSISYVAPGGEGAITFAEAATELVVETGRPVAIAGATADAHEVTRRILGTVTRHASTETGVFLTATIQ
jgi:hypothetical protein